MVRKTGLKHIFKGNMSHNGNPIMFALLGKTNPKPIEFLLVNTKSLMMVLSFRAQTSKASPVFHASIASNLASSVRKGRIGSFKVVLLELGVRFPLPLWFEFMAH